MYKIRKRPLKVTKEPELYNILENYTDFDPPGNVMVCAMAGQENLEFHAKILGESYEIPIDEMKSLLVSGGIYTYPETSGVVTRGLFVSRVDPTNEAPKQTWILDLQQYAAAEQLMQFSEIPLNEAVEKVFYQGLPEELQNRLKQKNLGLDYSELDRNVAKGGDITYIDFRKDWSPYFKRKCTMPDGTMVETGGVQEFADFHGITIIQAQELIDKGGTLEIEEGILACQIINNQPTIARFNKKQYERAQEIAKSKELHIMDALSEMALNDETLMRELKRVDRER